MQSGNAVFHPSLEPLLEDISNVTQHPDNARNGDLDAIIESIEVNGFVAPVIAQKSTGHIIAGNHRYQALHALGSEKIPVIWVDVDDAKALRYLLADNRTSDLGTYDQSQLVALMDTLNAIEPDLALIGTGYTEQDLEALRLLSEISPDDTSDIASWPTLSFTVPPHVRKAFYALTDAASSDRERFELCLRMAGWSGKKYE